MIITGLVFLLSGSSLVAAQEVSEGREARQWHQRGQGPEKIFEELGLSEEQKTQLKEIRQNSEKARENLKTLMDEKRQQLTAALQSATLNEQEVTRIHNELKGLKNQQEDQRLAFILEIRKVLTVEQFMKFDEKGRHFRQKHDQMRKNGLKGKKHGKFSGDMPPEDME
jgi:Spy/CpxP family protein refolding chaperone